MEKSMNVEENTQKVIRQLQLRGYGNFQIERIINEANHSIKENES